MSSERPRLFISSARGPKIDGYRDLASRIASRFGFEPVWMEERTPGRLSPREYCESQVSSCDAIIILVGERYGSLVPGMQISFTELEYDVAATLPEMPILVWTADPELEWSRLEISTGEDESRLARFKEKLSGHTRCEFSNETQFATEFGDAMAKLKDQLEKTPSDKNIDASAIAQTVAGFPGLSGKAFEELLSAAVAQAALKIAESSKESTPQTAATEPAPAEPSTAPATMRPDVQPPASRQQTETAKPTRNRRPVTYSDDEYGTLAHLDAALAIHDWDTAQSDIRRFLFYQRKSTYFIVFEGSVRAVDGTRKEVMSVVLDGSVPSDRQLVEIRHAKFSGDRPSDQSEYPDKTQLEQMGFEWADFHWRQEREAWGPGGMDEVARIAVSLLQDADLVPESEITITGGVIPE